MTGFFSFPTGWLGKNVIIFGVDMSSSVHVDNKRQDILILDEGPSQVLDNTTLTVEKNYSINFTEHNKMFCLSLHYNGANSYLFVNGVEIIKFKVRDSAINAIPLCLGKIWKIFSVDYMKKTGFYGCFYDFSIDYDAIAVDDILDIPKYLMKKNNMKQCLHLFKKCLLQQLDLLD